MYVKRASDNQIIALNTVQTDEYNEYLSNNDPDLLSFMQKNIPHLLRVKLYLLGFLEIICLES